MSSQPGWLGGEARSSEEGKKSVEGSMEREFVTCKPLMSPVILEEVSLECILIAHSLTQQ